MIRAILACDDDWGIGKAGTLPWPHNPADLAWFKQCTDGGVVVMGRKTWESLPRKPLPNRINYVVTSDPDIEPGYAGRFSGPNVNTAITAIIEERLKPEHDIWIIGGAQLIASCLPIVEEIWLSRIAGTYDCDTFLPRNLIETTYELYSSEREGKVYVDKWRRY